MSELKDLLLYVKEKNYKNTIPKREKRDKLTKYVIEYLKNTKRKIYGGTAINKFVKIYDDFEEPDYDVYTHEPKRDAIKLSHFLFNKDIKDVSVSRGVTEGTYKVFAFNLEAVDFSYMPKKMYDVIPFKIFDNLYYTDPEYLKIDLLLAIANPQKSIYLWEKILPRYIKLNNKFKNINPNKQIRTSNNNDAINLISKIIINNKDIILTGLYAYRILVSNTNVKNVFIPEINYLELLTQNPITVIKQIIDIYGIKNITIKYYNKFLKIIPSKYVVYYNDKRLVNIYHLEDKCFPFIMLDNILISSFDYLQLYFFAMKYQGIIIKNDNLKILSEIIIYNLDYCRNQYLKKQNTTVINDKLLQSFVYECYGTEKDQYKYYKMNIRKEGYNYKPKNNNIPNTNSGEIKNYLGEFRGDINVNLLYYQNKIKY